MKNKLQLFQQKVKDGSLLLGISLLLTGKMVGAEVPKVVVDIPPAHSLVALVMGEVGVPALILSPGASPHGYAMRPSEVRALNEAEIVFWVGKGLTPWLKRAIDTLASDSVVVELLTVDGLKLLDYRQNAIFLTHKYENENPDHEGADPHVWLDPENAKVWLDAIAVTLSKADPENAGAYFQNAATGKDELNTLITELSELLESIHGKSFIVFHDAYQYFEESFGIEASGAISLGDASDPGPARLLKIQDTIEKFSVLCVFSEPLYKSKFVSTVIEGTESRLGKLDSMGTHLEPGRFLYTQLLRNLAGGLVSCLK